MTIKHFQSSAVSETIIQTQFEHWRKPAIFEESNEFLLQLEVPVYILSNIDTADVLAAMNYHDIQATDVITSEDVRSYKPRPEMFMEAMQRRNLKPEEVIHIGDTLTSDVLGAQRVGSKRFG